MKLLFENWRRYLSEDAPQAGESSGAPHTIEPERTEEMTVGELLKLPYKVAYSDDMEEIDSDPEHEDRTWPVYMKVKEYQNYQKFIYFKDWDELEISMSKDGKSMEEIKEMKDYLERENVKMKKEKPKLYQRFEQLSVGDDKGKSKSKSKCSFTKMVDNIIENDIDLFGV